MHPQHAAKLTHTQPPGTKTYLEKCWVKAFEGNMQNMEAMCVERGQSQAPNPASVPVVMDPAVPVLTLGRG